MEWNGETDREREAGREAKEKERGREQHGKKKECLNGIRMADWLSDCPAGWSGGCLFAWLRAGWLAKLSDCLLRASSLLASKLAGLLGWLTACLLAPHLLRCPANLCGRRVAFCRCLTIRE